MAKLTTAARKKIPPSKFALPPGKYPVEDKPHARAAKSRASAQVNKGKMSPATEKKIDARADRVLGKKKGK